ncbi:beta-glucosidase [Subsaximicrobium wynnwilliamsii]|uniref:Beta-glucosidase n=1 Tax=Subsaximicrobium wynnwilliamsii TaxID=291179 RepID=A0A5C6ZCZ6_9FLAO|nr:glucoamylase family protein [Subsaximicrobium wynnwilliamsii]TXD81978.1 beta-glucosidase [Subsaximicrobium wynnwilliamsii]TXD87676.1 beta-glucosidase [Subsaximicrobium wynnwilliamsii]TXE01422.1 beta-glucosidase [Subsaximicrobium wynnwilliamsii]
MKKISVLAILIVGLCSCSDSSKSEPFDPNAGDDGPVQVEPLSDEAILDLTQKETFKYFWDFAQSNSGAARERYIPENPSFDQNTVATGGSGFGLMAILVGIERGYVSRTEAMTRLSQILTFFENADRFHGAWPHWINGTNGSVIPFSAQDNGGDLVETAFFVQGLICVKEYFKNGSAEELALSNKADVLWKGVEWNWYTQNENALYWHWSPNNGFAIDLKLTGYNEVLITYIMAASSPDFAIDQATYAGGWATNGNIVSSNSKYGVPLILKHAGSPNFGGPLFFSHYSFLGLNPSNLSDAYGNYWDVAKNHTKINRQYCIENPNDFEDYSADCWGLTASYSRNADGSLGYTAHSPVNDTGVISPTAAISSIPYTPMESLDAMHYFYQNKAKLLGPAGFYDAFSPEYDYWVARAYLAIDQGPQIIMIENYRSGLLWNLFMQNTDVQNGLTTLGFTY